MTHVIFCLQNDPIFVVEDRELARPTKLPMEPLSEPTQHSAEFSPSTI